MGTDTLRSIATPVIDAVRAAYRCGLNLLPTKDDGTKAPDAPLGWTEFKHTQATPEQMRDFRFESRSGYGFIAGRGSACRESWDFDTDEDFQAFLVKATECGIGELVDRIRRGYEDKTPGGGRRWLVEYPADMPWTPGNKLARRPTRPEEKKHDHDNIKTLIEMPLFAILAPSGGGTHPSGRSYEPVSGDFTSIANYTADERDDLMSLARTFDQMPRVAREDRPSSSATSSTTGNRPGEDWSRRTSWAEILVPAGWTFRHAQGDEEFWFRPGKTRGSCSATTNYEGSDRFCAFSTSTPFETVNQDVTYSKFGVYTLLYHGGDFKQAAKELFRLGYGRSDGPDPAGPDHAGGSEWPEPADIQSALPAVETFAAELLPASFRALVCDVTARMQVPIDFAAAAMVLCLASVVNRRARIQPKREDTSWQVVPNLWGGLVASPGYMKSPVIAAMTRPIQQIQSEWSKQDLSAANDFEGQKERYELDVAAWKESYKSHAKLNDRTPPPEKPKNKPERPTPRRLLLSDGTFEALHQTMAVNPAGVLVLRDELSGWLAQLEKPGREGERAFCLEAWNGDQSFTMERIGRGSIYAEACCMSLFGGIQPARLRSYLVDALRDGPSNDGLAQRLQVLVWPDTDPNYVYVDRAPDAESVERVIRVLRRLVNLDSQNPARFLFAADAQELFIEWLSELEARIRRPDDLHPALVAHLSKFRSLMPSLALLFELADRAASDTFNGAVLAQSTNRVSLEHAQQAAAWCDFLESHAKRVYSCVVTPQMRAARELATKIQTRRVAPRFSARDVYLKAWSGLDTPELVKLAAELLIDAGWLRAVPAEPGPGRPSMQFDVNPAVQA